MTSIPTMPSFYWLRWDLMSFLLRLALNSDPSGICLLSSRQFQQVIFYFYVSIWNIPAIYIDPPSPYPFTFPSHQYPPPQTGVFYIPVLHFLSVYSCSKGFHCSIWHMNILYFKVPYLLSPSSHPSIVQQLSVHCYAIFHRCDAFLNYPFSFSFPLLHPLVPSTTTLL
jgi:hypothetical protein